MQPAGREPGQRPQHGADHQRGDDELAGKRAGIGDLVARRQRRADDMRQRRGAPGRAAFDRPVAAEGDQRDAAGRGDGGRQPPDLPVERCRPAGVPGSSGGRPSAGSSDAATKPAAPQSRPRRASIGSPFSDHHAEQDQRDGDADQQIGEGGEGGALEAVGRRPCLRASAPASP